MTISRVGTDGGATGNGSAVPTYPTGIGVNDLIQLFVQSTGAITTPGGYTQIGSTVTSGSLQLAVFGKMSASESGTLSVTGTGRMCAGFAVRRGNWAPGDVTVNFVGFTSNTGSSATNIQANQLTGVPANCWLEAAGAGISGSGTSGTCTVSGTNWTETFDLDSAGASNQGFLDVADNTTDTGSANRPTFTWTLTLTSLAALSYYLRESMGSPLFFGSN